MTSGSVWTHLMVTEAASGALVEERQQRMPLPRVTGDPAVPQEHRVRGVHGGIDDRHRVGLDGRGGGATEALEEEDQVVHRDALLAEARGDHLRPSGEASRMVRG